jgi:hypothetical protein
VNGFSPILLPIVSVGFGITSATVATLLYFTMRNMRQRDEPKEEDISKRRGPLKKTSKRPQVSSSRNERTSPGALSMAPKPKVLMTGSSSPKRGAVQESRDEEVESG